MKVAAPPLNRKGSKLSLPFHIIATYIHTCTHLAEHENKFRPFIKAIPRFVFFGATHPFLYSKKSYVHLSTTPHKRRNHENVCAERFTFKILSYRNRTCTPHVYNLYYALSLKGPATQTSDMVYSWAFLYNTLCIGFREELNDLEDFPEPSTPRLKWLTVTGMLHLTR